MGDGGNGDVYVWLKCIWLRSLPSLYVTIFSHHDGGIGCIRWKAKGSCYHQHDDMISRCHWCKIMTTMWFESLIFPPLRIISFLRGGRIVYVCGIHRVYENPSIRLSYFPHLCFFFFGNDIENIFFTTMMGDFKI